MNHRLKNALFSIIAVAGLTAGGVAFAQEAPGVAPGGPALGQCKDDIAKLCGGIAAGGGRLLKCLHEHDAELSAGCKASMGPAARRAGSPAAAAQPGSPPPAPVAATKGPVGKPAEWGPMVSMRKSCASEIAKSCKDVQPGHGRVAVCLNEHPQDLGAGCKTAVDRVVGQMNARVQTQKGCEGDAERLCSDVPAGTARMAMCLGEHSAELSPECKKQITQVKAGWGKRDFGAAAKTPAAAAPVAPAHVPAAPAKAPTAASPVAPAPAPAPAKPATPPPPPPPPPAK